MSKSKDVVILADRCYIPAHLIVNKSLFKRDFTKVVNDVEHTLYKFHRVRNLFSVGIGHYRNAIPRLADHTVRDIRVEVPMEITCNFIAELRPEQVEVMDEWVSLGMTSGTLVARAGAGKTCMMSWLIASMQQKTLILVPTERILSQWKSSIYKFLGVAPGIIGGGVFTIGDITVASYKSLTSKKGQEKLKDIKKEFGLIIIDECHKACAPGWRGLVDSLPAKHKIGCTATRFRKDKTIFHLDALVGSHVVNMVTDTAKKADITIVRTETPFYFRQPNDYIKALDFIQKDKPFNTMVAKRIAADYRIGRSIIVLSPRIAQLEMIMEVLDSLGIPNGRLVSVTSQASRVANEELIQEGRTNKWPLFATDSLVGTGFDMDILDCMHLPYSYNNEGTFTQLVGRIERKYDGKPIPRLMHYFFKDRGLSQSQQANMQGLYSRLGYKVGFDDSELQTDDRQEVLIKTSNWTF